MTQSAPVAAIRDRADMPRRPRPRTVREWASVVPQRPALISSLGRRTYGELDAAANRVARSLRELVPEEGACVALLARNRPESVEVYLGCLRAGLELAPLNWHLPGDEDDADSHDPAPRSKSQVKKTPGRRRRAVAEASHG